MLSFIRSAAKNSLVYGLGNISTKLIGFILLPLYTSHLTVREYGILGLVEVSTQVIVPVFGLGLFYSFSRWYWDKDYADMRGTLMFTCMVCHVCIISGLIAAVVFFAPNISMLLFESTNYATLVILLTISSSLQILASIPSSLMQLQQRSVLFTVVNMSQLAVTLIGTVVCVAWLNMNVEGIYIAQTIGGVLYFLMLANYLRKNIQPTFSFPILKALLAVSLPLVMGSISSVAIAVADRYMLRYMGHLSDVGLYSLGYKIANTVYVIVVMSVNLALMPMFYKIMDEPNATRIYSKVMTYVGLGVMMCVIGISFFGREVIKALAQNPEYWNAYKVIPFVAMGIYFGMLKDIAVVGLNLKKKTLIISLIVLTISLTNIALNALLIPWLQTIGASVAALLSQIAFFVLIYLFAQRAYFVPYEKRNIALMSLVGAAAIFAGSLVQDMHLAVRLTVKTALLLSFPVVLYYLDFFETVELERLQSGWIKWKNPAQWKTNIVELVRKAD